MQRERERERERGVLSSKIIERQKEIREIKEKRAERQEELRKIKKKRGRKQKKIQENELEFLQFEIEKKETREILNSLKNNELENIPRLEKSKAPIAYGIILEFNKWPPAEEKAILAELKSKGLKEDGKFKRFKVWVYKYSQPRKVEEAEKLCDVFITFKSVQSCEPDVSVQPQQTTQEEFYEAQLRRAEEGYARAQKDYEKAKEDYDKAVEEHEKIKGMYYKDLKIKENAELDVQNDQQGVERARQVLERAKKRNNPKEIAWAEKRLKDRESMLANSKEWLKKAIKFYEEGLKEFKESESWVKESKKWLDDRKKMLQTKKDWLEEVRSKKPPQEPPKKPETPKPETPEKPKEDLIATSVNVKTCNVVSSKLNLHPSYGNSDDERKGGSI